MKTFTMTDFEAAKGLTEKVGKTLLHPRFAGVDEPFGFNTKLEKDEEESVELPEGSAAIRQLAVKLGSFEDPEFTRCVVLRMEFDGRETVWCPVGDFFGCGIGLHPFQGWYRTVGKDWRFRRATVSRQRGRAGRALQNGHLFRLRSLDLRRAVTADI